MAEFRRELELDPENTGRRAMLALFTMQCDATAALADAQRAALEKPADPLADYAFGKVLVATGAWHRATGNGSASGPGSGGVSHSAGGRLFEGGPQ